MQYLVIYPGRFHPFHKGHKSVYDTLVKKFGANNVFIATSDKVEPPKSPFSFEEKLKMINLTGIPSKSVVRVKNPYQATEIVSKYDPKDTVLLFAVSEKDMEEDPRFAFKPKKDGSPSYFQPANDKMEPLEKHGYILTVPTLRFTLLGKPLKSASEFRSQFAKADAGVQKQMIQDLYGTYSLEIHNLLDQKIKENLEEDLNTQRGRLEYFLKQPQIRDGMAIHLGKLPKYHDGEDELAKLVPERKGVYALHPDAWESTFYSLTNKDLNKLGRYKPAIVKVPGGSIVADMAIANQFYRTNNAEEKQKFAKAYKDSIVPYGSDISHIKMPEIIMPRLLESAGVGIVTKQNATKDVPVGGQYMNVKKLGLGDGPKELHKKARKNSDPNTLMNLGIGEKITKDTPMGDVIKDFYKSDAPQFKGKSKAKRRQMAIAAKLSALESALHELKEKYDQLKGTHKFTKSAKPGGKESPHPARGLLVGNKSIYENKEIKTKIIPYGFTLDLMVDGDHVGQYTHTRDDDIVRNFAEIFPEYRNKGYGTMLLLAAIKTADDMDMDFEEDTQSLTPAMSRLYDELSDSGLIYGGGGAWTVSPSGESELEDWLLEVTENFADGKKKGRKGLSKRVGVSQKMSIAQLKKITKNSTGERRRMAQWNLNMKRGRKK